MAQERPLRRTTRLLDSLPPLATFGIGSLPFIDEVAAVRHATRAYDVPFCPQLPALDGDMVGEWLGSDPARCGWTPDRDRPEPRAWAAFTAAMAARPPKHGVVKLQVTGPLTLAAGLQRAEGVTAFGRATSALASEISAWLASNAAQQIRALRAIGLETLLVVDEPGLALLSVTARDLAVWDPLRAVAPAWGLHVCGPVPWRLVEIAEPDLLSYDLVRYGLEIEAAHVLARHAQRGGRIAFGAIDATTPLGPEAIVDRVEGPLVAISRILDRPVAELATRTLLSPSCGTGRLSGQRERLVAAELGAASMLLRDFAWSARAADLHREASRPQSTGTP